MSDATFRDDPSTATTRVSRWHAMLLLSSVLVAGSAVAGTGAHAEDPPPVPKSGCATFSDPAGDDLTGDPSVDIVNVVLASPPQKLRAYIQVSQLDMPKAPGHVFSFWFLLNGTAVELKAGRGTGPAGAVRPALPPPALPITGVTYNGNPVEGGVVDVVFDTDNNMVVLTTDRAPIEKASGASLADGAYLAESEANAVLDFVVSMAGGDSAKSEGDYEIGDNRCLPRK